MLYHNYHYGSTNIFYHGHIGFMCILCFQPPSVTKIVHVLCNDLLPVYKPRVTTGSHWQILPHMNFTQPSLSCFFVDSLIYWNAEFKHVVARASAQALFSLLRPHTINARLTIGGPCAHMKWGALLTLSPFPFPSPPPYFLSFSPSLPSP